MQSTLLENFNKNIIEKNYYDYGLAEKISQITTLLRKITSTSSPPAYMSEAK
jgi:hypothetical protein